MKTVGTGTRALNFLIDTILVFLMGYIIKKAWDWHVYYYSYRPYNFGWFFAVAIIIYYVFFESLFARTPGKWVSQTKVINAKGRKPGFFSILIRTLVRLTVIDMFFIPFMDKPLHDYLSKTKLIEV